MKKIVLLFIWVFLLISVEKVNAQVWFQEGDSWVFDFGYFWGQRGYEEVWVDGDTLIEGQSCKILRSQQTHLNQLFSGGWSDTIVTTLDPYYVYEQSDSVFWYHENEFKLIYHFTNFFSSVEPFIIREGEGHPDEPFCDYEIDFYSIDTSSMFISGVNRQVVKYITPQPSTFYYEQFITVVEGIGIVSHELNGNTSGQNFGHIIPGKAYGCLLDSYGWRFCSFSANGEEYNPVDADCLELPITTATSDQTLHVPNYSLYPNPASTHFSIQNDFDAKIQKATIYNSKGSLEKMIYLPKNEIDISDMAKGIYIVEIAIGESLVYRKLVKQ